MAVPFIPSVTLQQSADGGTVIITDQSNYVTNTEGVTLGNIVSRTDVISNGLTTVLATITFAPGALTASVQITADAYLNNSLAFVIPGPITRTGTDNFLADNFYNNVAREVSRKLRCCNCNNLCNAAVKADLAHSEAVTSTLFGVPAEAQNAITDANSLINSEECSCR